MNTLIGENNKERKVGIGISKDLNVAVLDALNIIKDNKSIMVNIVGPKNMTLKTITKVIDNIRLNRDLDFSVSIEEELKNLYVVVIY